MKTIEQRINSYLADYSDLRLVLNTTEQAAITQQEKLDKIQEEQCLVIKSLQAIKDVIPLLCASSVDECVSLCNVALQAIFPKDYTLKYVECDTNFIITTEEGDTDLVEGNGGGVNMVISFIFNLFLLMKTKARRFMMMDECFTQLDDEALPKFAEFVKGLCASIGLDLLLITHDARILDSMVDGIYYMDEGNAIKIK